MDVSAVCEQTMSIMSRVSSLEQNDSQLSQNKDVIVTFQTSCNTAQGLRVADGV